MATLLLATPVEPAGGLWRGTVTIDGMMYEPGGYHPYAATISLTLREAEGAPTVDGHRVHLVSEGSTIEARTSVHQTNGLMMCSGAGREALPDGVVGYLELKGGKTAYQLALPRAFAAFACGRNNATRRSRFIVIGDGDPVAAEIEVADSVVRFVEERSRLMKGSFKATRTRRQVRYEYVVKWSLAR